MILAPSDYQKIRKGLSFWLKRWKDCPLAYVLECVGDTPTHQQAVILKAFEKHKFVAIRSGHGIGKSKLSGWLANWFLDTRYRKRVPCTGASGDQLKSILWPEVTLINEQKWDFLGSRYKVNTEQMSNKEVDDGWFAVLRTARRENPDALQGFHDCLFIIDEASGVADEIFEVARGAMGDPDCYGLMLGNPTNNSGYFFKAFQNKKSVWHCLHFSSAESMHDQTYIYDFVDAMGDIHEIKVKGRQTQAWVDDMREEFGEHSNVFRVRVLGEFGTGTEDLLVEDHWMKDVFVETTVRDKKRMKIMGVDVARSGNDDSGIVIRQGDDIVFLDDWHGKDTVITTEKVKAAFETHQVDLIVVDTIGVGAGVYDNLKHAGYPVRECIVSEKVPDHLKADPKKTRCKLLRDWLWWQSRLFFKQRPARFHGSDQDERWTKLRKELTTPTYKHSGGVVVVESKDELAKRGVASPNLADALNMTFMYDWFTGLSSGLSSTNRKKKRRKNRRGFKTC
tara:strand:- start:19 stop:1539 length:1521 start_codon:yes stop_codon:yes gene_type:complete